MYLTVSWSKRYTWNITARGTALKNAFSLSNISYLRKSPLGWFKVANFPGPCKELIRLVGARYCGRDNIIPTCLICRADVHGGHARCVSYVVLTTLIEVAFLLHCQHICPDKLVLVQLRSYGMVVDGSSG
jgi:hypothetical protein